MMKTIDDIRRENLIALRDQHGTAQVLADIMEISPTQISQWINAAIDFKSGKPRNISSRSCRKMELKLDLVSGWMDTRSEEHTSELQSLMRISYAVFCLKKKKTATPPPTTPPSTPYLVTPTTTHHSTTTSHDT